MARQKMISGALALVVGIFLLLQFNGDPRLLAPGSDGRMFHGGEILGLIVSGVCIGVGITLLSSLLKGRSA
jgi:hypothetical protein